MWRKLKRLGVFKRFIFIDDVSNKKQIWKGWNSLCNLHLNPCDLVNRPNSIKNPRTKCQRESELDNLNKILYIFEWKVYYRLYAVSNQEFLYQMFFSPELQYVTILLKDEGISWKVTCDFVRYITNKSKELYLRRSCDKKRCQLQSPEPIYSCELC